MKVRITKVSPTSVTPAYSDNLVTGLELDKRVDGSWYVINGAGEGQNPIRTTVTFDSDRKRSGLVRVLIKTTNEQNTQPHDPCCCDTRSYPDDVVSVHTVVTVPASLAEKLRKGLLAELPVNITRAIFAHRVLIGGIVFKNGPIDPDTEEPGSYTKANDFVTALVEQATRGVIYSEGEDLTIVAYDLKDLNPGSPS